MEKTNNGEVREVEIDCPPAARFLELLSVRCVDLAAFSLAVGAVAALGALWFTTGPPRPPVCSQEVGGRDPGSVGDD